MLASRIVSSLLVPAVLVCLGGCRIDERDIETWKGTIKGPGRLLAVVQSDRYPSDLRVRAALAMVEIDRQDVDGVAELYTVFKRLPSSQQTSLIDELTPPLVDKMSAVALPTDEEKAAGQAGGNPTGGTTAPTPVQTRAKDLAYLLVPLASAEAREKLVSGVIAWYLVDLNGRSLAGNYTAEQVVRSLGPVAAAPMVSALSARLPSASLVRVAKLIHDVGDQATKSKAALRLVEIEHEMESKAFTEWLAEQLRAQFTAQGAQLDLKKPADKKKLMEAAKLNQDNFIVQGILPAMKPFASFPVVTERLMSIATSRASLSVERRTQALQALETHVQEASLPPLLNLALDNGTPAEVRDLAFDRVGEIRSKTPIPRLWPLLQQNGDPRLRWRAGELILTLGGSSVLGDFFAKLPAAKEANYSPAELEGYATRLGQIAPPPTATVASALRAADPAPRVIGIYYLERRGSASDIATLQNFGKDSTALVGNGWPPGQTLGKLAQAASDNLRSRLAQPGGASATK